MSPGTAWRARYIPGGHDIAVLLARQNPVAQKAKSGADRSVMRGIVAMIDVHDHPPLRRGEASKLAHRFHSGGIGKDVPEDIPETDDYVEPAMKGIQLFSAHRAERYGRRAAVLHFLAGFEENNLTQVPSLGDLKSAASVACADIEEGLAARRYLGDYDLIDSVQIQHPLLGKAPEHRSDAIISGNGVVRIYISRAVLHHGYELT